MKNNKKMRGDFLALRGEEKWSETALRKIRAGGEIVRLFWF